jgi:hypothetical protein
VFARVITGGLVRRQRCTPDILTLPSPTWPVEGIGSLSVLIRNSGMRPTGEYFTWHTFVRRNERTMALFQMLSPVARPDASEILRSHLLVNALVIPR